MQFAIERGMRGKIDVRYEPEGIAYVIKLPWPGQGQEAEAAAGG